MASPGPQRASALTGQNHTGSMDAPPAQWCQVAQAGADEVNPPLTVRGMAEEA